MTLLKHDRSAKDPAYNAVQEERTGRLVQGRPPDFMRQHVEELYSLTQHVLDEDFAAQIKHNFHARYAEMYFAATFIERNGFKVTHPSDTGPDFFLENLNCWAEVVTATDGDESNPNSIEKQSIGAKDTPHNKVILRLSSVFSNKSKKTKCYMATKRIKPSQPIVICIHGGGMQNERIPRFAEDGVPPIVETLLPMQLVARRSKIKNKVSFEHVYHNGVEKQTKCGNKLISTSSFLKDEFAHISAVIYAYANAADALPRNKWGVDFFTVHNPKAINPLSAGFIKCGTEYLVSCAEDSFTIEPIDHD